MTVGNLVLYHGPPTRSVRCFWLLKELDVPFEVVKKDLFKPETIKNEEYAKINPLQSLPALTDGPDVKLWESGAIMQYILAKYGKGSDLRPAPGTPESAEFLKWFWFTEATLCTTLVGLLMHAALLPEEKRVASEAERFGKALKGLLEVLEKQLEGKEYILGEKFSAVDINLGQNLYLAINFAKAVPEKEFPLLTAYYAKLSERPGFKAAYET